MVERVPAESPLGDAVHRHRLTAINDSLKGGEVLLQAPLYQCPAATAA